MRMWLLIHATLLSGTLQRVVGSGFSCYHCANGMPLTPNISTYMAPASGCVRKPINCIAADEVACVWGKVVLDGRYGSGTSDYVLSGCYAESAIDPFTQQTRCFKADGQTELDSGEARVETQLFADYCLCFHPLCNGADFESQLTASQLVPATVPDKDYPADDHAVREKPTTMDPFTSAASWRRASIAALLLLLL